MRIQEDISLASYTVIKIGGPARYFCDVTDANELEAAVRFAAEKELLFFVLGAGSNVLISDNGFPGLVIHLRNHAIKIEGETAYAGAGVMMPRLAMVTVQVGLTGFEWGTGIPGTVGGSIRGNAGCFGGEVRDNVESVMVFDTKKVTRLAQAPAERASFKLQATSCGFGYRESIFKKRPEWIIVDATFKLKKINPATAQNIFRKIQKKSKERVEEQPIGEKTMGSTFKGVTASDDIIAFLRRANIAWQKGVNRRGFLSAGFLIEYAGLKGCRIGGAEVSSRHANFIINTGTATASDVVELVTRIKDTVKDKFGISLEEEIQYLGF